MSLYNEVFAAEYRYQREFRTTDIGPALERAREAAERVEHIIAQTAPRRVEMLPRERPELDGIAEAMYSAWCDPVIAGRWAQVSESLRANWRRVAEAAIVALDVERSRG